MQWGSVDYHRQSLRNLQKASQQTRHMCAVILDTVGRELMIRRDFTFDHEVRCTHSTHTAMPNSARKPCGLHMYASVSLLQCFLSVSHAGPLSACVHPLGHSLGWTQGSGIVKMHGGRDACRAGQCTRRDLTSRTGRRSG